MAIDPRKRQKQQERRTAKRKTKHLQLVREKPAGLAERLTAAAKHPIFDCWVTESLWTRGMGWVCLSRELSNGSVAFTVFLLDRFCLGVKDVMAGVMGRFAYVDKFREMRSQFEAKAVSPAAARKLVEAAVAYAEALGIQPHGDYDKIKGLFGDIDASACADTFEFGKDGKPFFIAGPNDTPARCRQILSKLEQHCGKGSYNSLIPLTPTSQVVPESLPGKPVPMLGPDDIGTLRDGQPAMIEDQRGNAHP